MQLSPLIAIGGPCAVTAVALMVRVNYLVYKMIDEINKYSNERIPYTWVRARFFHVIEQYVSLRPDGVLRRKLIVSVIGIVLSIAAIMACFLITT
jgi:hypothetical protein